MYLFLIILAGVMARNAPGAIGLLLGGGQAASGFVGALEGPASTQKGTFSFGGGTQVKLG